MYSNPGYQLSPLHGLVRHFPLRSDTVQDVGSHIQIDARVRSGDYLATLVTELEQIVETMRRSTTRAPEAVAIERLIAELVYIDKSYQITKR